MKILIVEDDDNLRGGLQDLLKLEGFKVVVCADIVSGLDLYRHEKPDFCILDIMLVEPDDGYTLCRKIRKVDQDTPILMLSARSEEIDRVLGFECGADDYLLKPFGPRELVARIRAISRRSIKSTHEDSVEVSSDCFNMNGLQIDPNALRAFRGDIVIELTLRDVRILKLLYEKAGIALHRDEVFDVCWGRDFMPNSRALDQYISALRKKIETKSGKENNIISTVRGVGYRFDPID